MSITPAVPDPPELDQILWSGFSFTDVAFDVGANCGQTIGKIQRFSETVVAFEPSVEAFEYLAHRYKYRPGIVLSNLAVSDVVGEIELIAAVGKIETGQLVTPGTPGMEWSEAAEDGSIRVLPSTTLDAYSWETGLWPGFLKIDVEGHEGHVLDGATDILSSGPEMLIEVHSEELGDSILDLLAVDFRLELIRHPHYPAGSELWKTHFWYKCFPFKTLD